MLDDWQEAFALALIQLGYSANTESTAELDEALALLERAEAARPDVHHRHDHGDVQRRPLDRPHLGRRPVPDQPGEREHRLLRARGGWRQGLGHDATVFSGAQHPIAAHLFINHLLDAEISASNTNYIGYMGPNAAAKEFIDPAILDDPAVNPDQAIVDKLQELLDLDQAVRDEYLNRWQTLRGG